VLLSLLATIAAWRGDGTEAWLSVGADDAAKVAARPRATPRWTGERVLDNKWITVGTGWKEKGKQEKKKEEKKGKGKKKWIILFIFKNYDSQILICLLLLHNEK
jgi:hypothetical protein